MLRPTRVLILLLAAACAGAQPPATSKAPLPQEKSIVYTNTQYGFRFSLPPTWKGYSVLEDDTWSGTPIVKGEPGPARQEKGPLIRIRNPHWTEPHSYEDIPIMIFTRAQWAMVENDMLITGAAPIPPSELAHNAKYVFALPARYNYDFSTGWEEVEKIIAAHPIGAF